MRLNSKKILVGIFSYNEGENLRRMYNQLRSQCLGPNYTIVLIDKSDEPFTINIVNEINMYDGVINISTVNVKRGKVYAYNLLFDYFLKNNYDILLHFDADHTLSADAVVKLVKSIEDGFDISTCLNKPFKRGNLFQRILYIMAMPGIMARENRTFDLTLVGHNGAYGRNAIEKIGIIPPGGIDDELYVLSKVLACGLSHTIVLDAMSYFTLPGNIGDYVRSTRRVYGRVKSFKESCTKSELNNDAKNHSDKVVRSIYSRPPVNHILRSLTFDPFAALFTPYLFLVRWVVMKAAQPYRSDTWETVQTTKILGS